MKKIMLIDDEPSLHIALEELLTSNDYLFCGAYSGKEGLAMLKREKPDLLLLDIMLPDDTGFDICAKIRQEGRHIPIIFLSAKGDIVDKSIGYRAGADDYVTKPFDSAELLLRILAGIRRHEGNVDLVRSFEREKMQSIGDLEIDFSKHKVLLRGTPVDLTSKEFNILALLVRNAGMVFSREQIYEEVWGEGSYKGKDSVTVFVRKIREKIEDNPSNPKYLLTIPGFGYQINSEL